MTILCQERCVRAVEILAARGATFSYHWLCYVGCILVWLYTQVIPSRILGKPIWRWKPLLLQSHIHLFDSSICLVGKSASEDKSRTTSGGFYALAQKVCPTNAKWLREVTSQVVKDPAKAFSQLASECQQLHFRLVAAGVLTEGVSTGNP